MKKEDKDAIIKHLMETLDKIEEMAQDMYYGRSSLATLRDYIWKRKAEVTF